MQYSKVHIDAIGYELPPIVVATGELEARIAPVLQALRIAPGQVEALTGIRERRWWEPGFVLSDGATAAARHALEGSGVAPGDIGALIYGGVNREYFEPSTACAVADAIGTAPDAAVYDLSNACLGVLNGMLEVANRIELGQIRAGLVVSCETSREINDIMIEKMKARPEMDYFVKALATLTGGSGAVAVLLTDGSFASGRRRQLLGGVTLTEPRHHRLCRWGVAPVESGAPGAMDQFMYTDSVAVLNNGVALAEATLKACTTELGVARAALDKIICHQVGSAHQSQVLKTMGIDPAKDFPTYPWLGNIGTCSLPITAAIAEERDHLVPGDLVGFFGIGSGLNCIMMGVRW